MYYESTEKVTDRRLGMNGRNRSFYTTLVVAIAVAFNWAVANPQYLCVALAATGLISLVAIIFSVYWSAQVKPTFRTLIQHFLELSKSATNPATMRLYSSRLSTSQDHRHLGTLWATTSILRGSCENRCPV
jgi:hypothetical protein